LLGNLLIDSTTTGACSVIAATPTVTVAFLAADADAAGSTTAPVNAVIATNVAADLKRLILKPLRASSR
jgi:hypothetical protein